MFSLQHIVQRRGAILEALYRISKGFWFSPAELIMTSLFHFEDRVHRQSLPRAKSMPLLFPRLLYQVLEHIGFPAEPRLERRYSYEATLTIDWRKAMPRAFHLPPPSPAEDEPTADSPLGDLSPIAEHIEEPPAPAQSVPPSVPPAPPTTAPVPPAPMPSIPSKPSVPMPTTQTHIAGPSTSAPPQQYISISTKDFLTIMEAVYTFSTTAASFAASLATLVDRMTRTEAVVAQTSAILTQNKAILMQLQSHMGLPVVSPYVPAQASATPPPTGSAPPPPTPTDPLDVLVAAATSATPPEAPQHVQAKDDSSLVTH